jgi:hypothetical protein
VYYNHSPLGKDGATVGETILKYLYKGNIFFKIIEPEEIEFKRKFSDVAQMQVYENNDLCINK